MTRWRGKVVMILAPGAVALAMGLRVHGVVAQEGVAQGLEVPGCGNLANAYGPFDYTNASNVREKLPVVETYHFDKGVEALKGQEGSGASLGADLDYTLRAFPNHHRALDAIGRYQLQLKQAPVPGAHYSAECYFERAMTFAPQDGVARMVYGIYLTRKGDRDGALKRYLEAKALMPESTELAYNLGLLYTSLQRYDDAVEEAQRAYAGGFPLMGLKNKLLRLGVWREPPAPTTPSTDAAQATPENGDEAQKPAPDAAQPSAAETHGAQGDSEPEGQ
jgi:tetratricopeptide (TPR) repeat protein